MVANLKKPLHIFTTTKTHQNEIKDGSYVQKVPYLVVLRTQYPN